ncbi:MAG: hypothetical protein DCF22_04435 [Leptolyngbya sp.]|nr:MAG: hypothetical protein DCF22_04435 [Leptolyngbya sp.]
MNPKDGTMSQIEEIRQQILNSLGSTSLDLSDKRLTELPAEIGLLENLRSLKLFRNRLTELPAEIGQLQNLQSLYLYQNQLTALPAEIGQLQNLRTIRLCGNQLTALPAEIGQLQNLQFLSLSGNQLTALPAEIRQLEQLLNLCVDENQLTALPAEIGQLQNLHTICLCSNQLTALPAEIGQLQNLQSLNLSNNPIPDLSALAEHPNPKLTVYLFNGYLPRRYWMHLSQWRAEWLLTERNAEVRKLLIRQIGYDRICQELQAIKLDSWREYTLLKIDADVDIEPIYLLKMTCPSTGHIHALRVPPGTSARKAIRWTNWDVDPETFAAET